MNIPPIALYITLLPRVCSWLPVCVCMYMSVCLSVCACLCISNNLANFSSLIKYPPLKYRSGFQQLQQS